MDLQQRDLAHIWHPCSQMKDYETFAPLEVVAAQGSYLELADGRHLIDAISSWWCKLLGHQHPRLQQALIEQAEKFTHVILANTTNQAIVELGERLAALTDNLDKVLFAGDGSCAVEIALKLSLQSHVLQGNKQRTQFMALENAYHGETLATLAISDMGIYRDAFAAQLPETYFIRGLPYVSGKDDPLWHDCSTYWPAIEAQLNAQRETLAAVIVEPILQGAGGMLVYSQDFLRRLRAWTQAQGIHLIADEILTGFGRTGTALACEHADIEPDFLCLAKGLTAGMIPMSVCLTSTATYNLFYDDYEKGKSFLHSHTHSGNALGVAIANATLAILAEENWYQTIQNNQRDNLHLMLNVAEQSKRLHNIRSIGNVVAADLITENPKQRLGYAVYQRATELGALLRPLANTIYWMPPINTRSQTMQELADITLQAITDVYAKPSLNR